MASAQPRLGLAQRRLERAAIDLEEHLALPHVGAFAVGAAQQVAGDLRPDLGVDDAVEGGDPLAGDRDALGRHGDDRDRRRRRRRRRGGGVLVAAAGGRRAAAARSEAEGSSLFMDVPTPRGRLGRPHLKARDG